MQLTSISETEFSIPLMHAEFLKAYYIYFEHRNIIYTSLQALIEEEERAKFQDFLEFIEYIGIRDLINFENLN